MTAAVVRLPTAAPSFIRVRRRGKWWLVELVTPCGAGVNPITSRLARSNSGEAAIRYAAETGARMQRPVKLPRGCS